MIVELLEGAPPATVQAPVLDVLAEVRRDFGLGEPRARIAKVGRRLYVEVEVPVPADVTVGDEERARAALRRRLDELPFDVWLTFEMRAAPDPAT